jgi:hypothetical protein
MLWNYKIWCFKSVLAINLLPKNPNTNGLVFSLSSCESERKYQSVLSAKDKYNKKTHCDNVETLIIWEDLFASFSDISFIHSPSNLMTKFPGDKD